MTPGAETKKQRAERRLRCAAKLEMLAEFLEALPDSRFNFNYFGMEANGVGTHKPEENACGAIGCAAGWLDHASGGRCHAWRRGRFGDWKFYPMVAENYLEMDTDFKVRAREVVGMSDFERLFFDSDNKLSGERSMADVPKAAVIARIRACAADYRRRATVTK